MTRTLFILNDARGIAEGELAAGIARSTLGELAAWTQWAEKILVF